MIIVFYTFAAFWGLVGLWCTYYAMHPWDALARGAAPAALELHALLAFLIMVVCLAAASILQRLDALRQTPEVPVFPRVHSRERL